MRRVLNGMLFSLAMLSLVVHAEDPAPPRYPDQRQILEWRDPAGTVHPVKTAADWRKRREHVLLNFQEATGSLPDWKTLPPLDVQITETDDTHPKFVLQRLTYVSDLGDRVPAYLLLPKATQSATSTQSPAKLPAMLALHQTNNVGKKEPAGLGGLPSLQYGRELAERGYIVLIPDYPSFGEYAFDFSQSPHISGTIKGVINHMRAVDLLSARDDVDPERIGVIGHSLGGHNAIFLGVFDERVKVIVSSCGWTPLRDYYNGNLEGWTSARYIPLVKTKYKLDPDLVPFDYYGLIAALAPRGFYSASPLHDNNFEVAGVRKVMTAVQPIYALYQAEPRLVVDYPDCAHDFPAEVRERAYQFIDQTLRKDAK